MTELQTLIKENASLIRELKYNVKEKAKFIEMLLEQLLREEEKVCALVEVLKLAYANLGPSDTTEHTFFYVRNKIQQALAKVEGKE